MDNQVTFYHNPRSRALVTHWMLEECEADYQIKWIDLQSRQNKSPDFLEVNPMGKLPTIVHRGVVITESAAICAYLADAFPKNQLAPTVESPMRGTYFRWLFFAANCLEWALMDISYPREQTCQSSLGYGTYQDTLDAAERAVCDGPFILGEHFSAADVFFASTLWWGQISKSLEPRATLAAYVKRCLERPAYQRMQKQLAKASQTQGTP